MKSNLRSGSGFTIVELLIVIVVLGILALLVILAYPGIQVRVRNQSMVAGARQYTDAIEAYRSLSGQYPTPPDGFSDSDRGSCLGEGYSGGVCLIDDALSPPNITNMSWFDTSLHQINSHLPTLPINLKWMSGSNPEEAGAFYVYTAGLDPASGYGQLLASYGVSKATAVVAYYLEGDTPQTCQIPGSRSRVFHAGIDSTDKDLTICIVPLGDVVLI